MTDEIEAVIVDEFEKIEAPDGAFLTQYGIEQVTGKTANEVKSWLWFPPSDLSLLLEIGRQDGVKGVKFTPVREVRAAVKNCLDGSADTGEIPTDAMRRLLHAWSLIESNWRERCLAQVRLDQAKAVKNGTPRSAKVLDTIAAAFETFDPERHEGNN